MADTNREERGKVGKDKLKGFLDWLRDKQKEKTGPRVLPVTAADAEKLEFAHLVILELRGAVPAVAEVKGIVHERGLWGMMLMDRDNDCFCQLPGKTYGKTWRLWLQYPNGGQWRAVPWD